MTYKEKHKIRNRDHYWYNKLHGAIPEGYTMHHNYYNELWYDEDSFIIITKEEHEWIHGCAIPCSKGFDRMKYDADNKEMISERSKEYYSNNKEKISDHKKEYYANNKETISERSKEYYANNRERINNNCKEYNKAHKEEIKEQRANYYQLNKDKIKQRTAIYDAKVKAVRESLGLTDKQWRALTKEDRKQFMDAFIENGGNMI